jgi:hypothetical protein
VPDSTVTSWNLPPGSRCPTELRSPSHYRCANRECAGAAIRVPGHVERRSISLANSARSVFSSIEISIWPSADRGVADLAVATLESEWEAARCDLRAIADEGRTGTLLLNRAPRNLATTPAERRLREAPERFQLGVNLLSISRQVIYKARAPAAHPCGMQPSSDCATTNLPKRCGVSRKHNAGPGWQHPAQFTRPAC